MARKDNLSRLIRDEWPARLDSEFEKRFWCKLTTQYNVLRDPPSYVSNRVDGEPLTPEQLAYIHGFSVALSAVYIWNGRV